MAPNPHFSQEKSPQTELVPCGTCYQDAWRFLIKEEEGLLVHGSVESSGKRIAHAWVETETGYVWEPESKSFINKEAFYRAVQPQVGAIYTPEQAAIMAARTNHFGPWAAAERQEFLTATVEDNPEYVRLNKLLDLQLDKVRDLWEKANKYEKVPDESPIGATFSSENPYKEAYDAAYKDYEYLRGQIIALAMKSQKEKGGPSLAAATEQISAVDYWNKHLEHNPLRVKVAETSAGATVSWILEAAGDILREADDPQPDAGYITEKVRRIEKELPVRTWTEPLSERDKNLIEEVRKRLEGLPSPDPLHVALKWLMKGIVNRDRDMMRGALVMVKKHLGDMKLLNEYDLSVMKFLPKLKPYNALEYAKYVLENNMFREDEVPLYSGLTRRWAHGIPPKVWRQALEEVGGKFVQFGAEYILSTPGIEGPPHMKEPKKRGEYWRLASTYNPAVVSKYPSGTMQVTIGEAVVEGRFQRKGEIDPGQTEPHIVFTVVNPGSTIDEIEARKRVEETLRADIIQVEDSEELKRVGPIVKVPSRPGVPAFPLVLTTEEYRRDWESKGWKIIFIGPTSTWRQEWGTWEAIRDLVQNALDETEAYQWGYDDMGLWLADKGRGVAVADFLLGPPKLKPDYARGRFGEGMKIASLALVRGGYGVHVETVGRELWMVFLEQEADGKVQSLAALWRPDGTRVGTKFHIVNYFGDSYEDRFVINLPKSAFVSYCPSTVERPEQRYNSIIEFPFQEGNRIYARDIYMRPINSVFSYNLWGFDMAPDRFGPRDEDHVWIDIGRTWCCVNNVRLLQVFLQMVADPPQIETDESHKVNMAAYQIGADPATGRPYREHLKENAESWKAAWKAVFGEQSVIRTNHNYDGIVKHLGYESVSLMWSATTALSDIVLTDKIIIDQSQERLSEVQVIPDRQLNERQIAHLKLARAIAEDVAADTGLAGVRAALIPPASDRVRTAGMYGRTTRQIFIHIEQLRLGRNAVDTVIHELAHHISGAEDAEEVHNREMTRIAGEVVRLTSGRRFDPYIEAPGFMW